MVSAAKEALIYSALPVRGRMPRRESNTKCLIHGARRGRVLRRGELKNATEGIFKRFHRAKENTRFFCLATSDPLFSTTLSASEYNL
jgi:hypothetical protein